MPIVPLPQFEQDLAEYLREKEDREAYERLNAPTSIVVRFGAMKMVGEFPYDGRAKPGCGSKLVVRTHRGEELGEMLTSTCPNAGCSKSVTRREMLEYIENSGGKDYPFFDARQNRQGVKGRVLRIATKEDLDRQAALDGSRREMVRRARAEARAAGFDAKIVDAEPILGGGFVAYYYLSEQRIDHGEFLGRMKALHEGERVEVRQVGARDEARLTADYERCGQHCCCKNFLKVLKPVSMRSAKVQKATLDPLKISGRCGRLMCCLRYEDATYKELKQNLPHRKTRVGTPHGDGIVIDSQILTQLVLVELDNRERVAVPVEELTAPEHAQAPAASAVPTKPAGRSTRPAARPPRRPEPDHTADPAADEAAPRQAETGEGDAPAKRRRRRRRKTGGASGSAETPSGREGPPNADNASTPTVTGRRRSKPQTGGAEASGSGESDPSAPKPKRRRRRRRSLGGGGDREGGTPSSENGPTGDPGPSDGPN